MTGRIFVDTSILVRAHDLDAGIQRAIAEHVLRQLWSDKSGVVSVQVLQEFYTALTDGPASPVPRRAARDLIGAYSVWPCVALGTADLLAAADVEERYRLSYRDAQIVVSARNAHASLLLSDEVRPFRPVPGLEVQNPFLDSVTFGA